ncbi:DNA alkylation repair protein [Clostridium sp. 'deep sea']|uniref:DNA alkylation repair protein n=1 Tax=Clostridium sp. 'deep sea' TaxID=2779445 RepID=UPI0018969781|nr:DNA alkylation repair protein [Clostridium sp. 'deep sea']QOR36177.1 DNA alkylation repair protein [Clostridium sp. 'deep sea']
MAEKQVLLKDNYFNERTVGLVIDSITSVYPSFQGKQFLVECLQGFSSRELKDRMIYMREALERYLPSDYNEALTILLNSLNHITEATNFTYSAYTNYVRVNGCTKQHLKKSLHALGEFTPYFSSEFAIRRFINEFPDTAFNSMKQWSLSDSYHQRRLASEGLRPKLPWAMAINFDYKKGATVLDNLFYDNKRYVTRSVANHLNDISKLDPDFVLQTLKRWQNSGKQNDKEMQYIINHSLRTCVKKGHLNTLKFLGYSPNAHIEVSPIKINNTNLKLGDYLEFKFDIKANNNENLIIDYKITYPTPTTKSSQKVFKIKMQILNTMKHLKLVKGICLKK